MEYPDEYPDEYEYPDEMNHPWHTKHPLRLLQNESDVICLSCGKLIEGHEGEECYGCNNCGDFYLHLHCALNSPSFLVDVDKVKIHEHALTLLPREISFTCSACGEKGNVSPYVCLSCSFMVHTKCIDLPRVIRITRYPHHRLFYSFSLASEKKLDCGVCHKGIDGRYGAYSCQVDPDYAVHPRCAVREDVWDGIDLEGVPEDEGTQLGPPFTKVSEDTIKHFSHRHELRRLTDTKDDDALCYACNLHVSPNPFYKCVEENCGFLLHETPCVNLPLETKILTHQHTLTLHYEDGDIFKCSLCHHFSNGFKYSCSLCNFRFNLDTKCASLAEGALLGGHDHPLYFSFDRRSRQCISCTKREADGLVCEGCEIALCFACATLPSSIPYGDDAHPLSLNHSGNALGELLQNLQQKCWCNICEGKVEPLRSFFKCPINCGTMIHVECTIGGDLRNLRTGLSFNKNGYKYEVVPNNQVTRPLCNECKTRCRGPSMLCYSENNQRITAYFCSLYCAVNFMIFEEEEDS